MGTRKRFLTLLLFISMVALTVGGLTITILYLGAMNDQRARLHELTKSQSIFVKAMILHSLEEYKDSDRALSGTIDQILEAYGEFQSFGITGEFLLARRDDNYNDYVRFLTPLPPEYFAEQHPTRTKLDVTDVMLRAVLGEAGTVTGVDHRGETVLMAYRPVGILDLGILAKIDIAEVRAPFLKSARIASIYTVVVIVLGTAIFFIVSNPFIRQIQKQAETALQEKESLYTTILNNTLNPINLKDVSGHYLFVNKVFADRRGTTADEIIGKTAHDYWSNEVANGIEAHDREVLRTGEVTESELVSAGADGMLRQYIGVKFPVFDKDGRAVAIGAVHTDITERKRIEERLKIQEQQLLEAQRIGHIGHWSWDVETDRFECSEEIYRLYGTDPDGLISWELVTGAIHEDERAWAKQNRETAMAEKRGYDFAFRIRRTDGELRFVEGRTTPVFDAAGELAGFFGITQDITERKRIEQALSESNARLQAILDYAPTKMHIKDTDGGYILINRQSEKLFGVTDEEARGKTSKEIFSDRVASSLMGHDQRVLETGQAIEAEEEWRIEDKIHTYLTVKFPIYDPTGEISGTGAVGTDITELKQAELALAASERLHRTVISTAAEGYWQIDRSERATEVNDAMCRILGYDRQEIIGRTTFEFLGEEDREILSSQLAIAPTTEQRRYEIVLKAKSGEAVPARIAATSLFDDDGEYAGAFAFITDLTEERRAQAQLFQAAKLATLGDMATGIAHELNQPLNVIRMAADSTVERVEDGPVDAEYLVVKLKRISAQTERAAEIIDRMHVFGSATDGESKLLDPRTVVENAIGLIGGQLRDHDIAVDVEMPAHCQKVPGHDGLLQQTLLNVLTNSHDAIEERARALDGKEGASPQERISVRVEDDLSLRMVRIIVDDTGGGIPEGVIGRIFEPFFTTKEVGKGTGLGLSSSYGVVSELGGTMEASNIDGGTRIAIALPAAEIKPEAASDGESKDIRVRDV